MIIVACTLTLSFEHREVGAFSSFGIPGLVNIENYHEYITRGALDNQGFHPLALNRVVFGNWDTDYQEFTLTFSPTTDKTFTILRNRTAYNASHHFDRHPDVTNQVAFLRSLSLIQKQRSQIVSLICAKQNTQALQLLGRTLHTLQDFFSHSNYVEGAGLGPNRLPSSMPQGLKLTSYDPSADNPEEPLEARVPPTERYTHGSNSKDDPDKNPNAKRYFLVAYSAALIATRTFVSELKADVLKEANGNAAVWNEFLAGTDNILTGSSVDRVVVVPTLINLAVGETSPISATAYDSCGNVVSPIFGWDFPAFSNPKVASIDKRGIVTGLVEGAGSISVKAGDKVAVVTVIVISINSGNGGGGTPPPGGNKWRWDSINQAWIWDDIGLPPPSGGTPPPPKKCWQWDNSLQGWVWVCTVPPPNGGGQPPSGCWEWDDLNSQWIWNCCDKDHPPPKDGGDSPPGCWRWDATVGSCTTPQGAWVFDGPCQPINLGNFIASSVSLEVENVTSGDPNDKVGGHGIGDGKWVSNNEPLRYAIYFENKSTATADAQDDDHLPLRERNTAR